MLFQDREHLLGLYNAVSGRDYTDPERLEIVTLENAVYMGMKSDLEKAVDKAVEECIREDILRKFLLQNRAEVKKMSIYEYDDEAVKQALKKDAYEAGKLEGKTETLVTQVCKKMRMAQPLEKIAEDLVEEVSVIEPIYRTAEKFAPEYDAGLVFENMNGTI